MASTSADVLFLNVRAFTAEAANPSAEAVAVKGNRILFVGSAEEAHTWRGPGTHLVDGGQCTLMPGFIDSHFHMLLGSPTGLSSSSAMMVTPPGQIRLR